MRRKAILTPLLKAKRSTRMIIMGKDMTTLYTKTQGSQVFGCDRDLFRIVTNIGLVAMIRSTTNASLTSMLTGGKKYVHLMAGIIFTL